MGLVLTDIVLASNGSDEPKAAPSYGTDQPLLLAGVPDRMTNRGHSAAERRVGNNAAVPNARDQFVLADDLAAVPNEKFQTVENERLRRDETSSSSQFPSSDIERVVFKSVEHAGRPRGSRKAKTGSFKGKARISQGLSSANGVTIASEHWRSAMRGHLTWPAIVLSVAAVGPAIAADRHSWYPHECRAIDYCAVVESIAWVVPQGANTPQPMVSSVHGRAIVPQSISLGHSGDGRIHVCLRYDPFGSLEVTCLLVPSRIF